MTAAPPKKRTHRDKRGPRVVFAQAASSMGCPYPHACNIPMTARFIAVTVAAHGIFALALGLTVCWLWLRAPFAS